MYSVGTHWALSKKFLIVIPDCDCRVRENLKGSQVHTVVRIVIRVIAGIQTGSDFELGPSASVKASEKISK